jgi:hypothetical protein
VITFEIVHQGLTNLTMCTEAAKVSGKFTSMDIFKEKLTQIEELLQAKSKPTPVTSRNEYINEVAEDFRGKDDSRNVKAVGNKKNKKKGKGKANNRHTNAVNKPPPAPRSGATGTRPSCIWCKRLGHTYEQCWTRDPTLRPPHLQVKSVDNTNRHGYRHGGPRANHGRQNQARANVNACSYANCTNNNCNENEIAGISVKQKDFINFKIEDGTRIQLVFIVFLRATQSIT